MKEWTPTYADMVSGDADVETIKARHAYNLKFFGATEADCELTDVRACESWQWGKVKFRLLVRSYIGWRVYMLHTGCIASMPEYETADVLDTKGEKTMGFSSIDCKLGNMRKTQNWTIYPVADGATDVIIQCEQRIARVNLADGQTVLSDGKGGHQGFIKLNPFCGAKPCVCPADTLNNLREYAGYKG